VLSRVVKGHRAPDLRRVGLSIGCLAARIPGEISVKALLENKLVAPKGWLGVCRPDGQRNFCEKKIADGGHVLLFWGT
jgi:hypothetical protein